MEFAPIVRGLLRGEPVRLLNPQHYLPCGVLQLPEYNVTVTLGEPKLHAHLGQAFLSLIQQRPFPFVLCRVCGNVFVQTGRGKRPRYCSSRCRARGIPSAAHRAAYLRSYRRKKRGGEARIARRIMRAWPKADHYAQLEKQFPRKSRRELLYILKLARAASERPGDTRRKEK